MLLFPAHGDRVYSTIKREAQLVLRSKLRLNVFSFSSLTFLGFKTSDLTAASSSCILGTKSIDSGIDQCQGYAGTPLVL